MTQIWQRLFRRWWTPLTSICLLPGAKLLPAGHQIAEAKLSALRNALDEFQDLIIPQDLAEAEQRRLQALCSSIQNQINQMADGIRSEVSDVVPVSSDNQQPEDVQPLINNTLEVSDNECADESAFSVRFSQVSFCHLPSSGGLGCGL